MTEPQRIAGFLDPGYSCRVPPHVQQALALLALATGNLRAIKPYRSLSKSEAEMIAGTLDRATALLNGQEPRYPALEAENASAAE